MGGNNQSKEAAAQIQHASHKYKARRKSNPHELAGLIKRLSFDCRLKLLLDPGGDEYGRNSLLWAISSKNAELGSATLHETGLTSHQVQQLVLSSKDSCGYNVFHYAARSGITKSASILVNCLEALSAVDQLLLDSENPTKSNVFHILASRASVGLRDFFLSCLSEQKIAEALLAQDHEEMNPIQIAARHAKISNALYMLSKLPDPEYTHCASEILCGNTEQCISRALQQRDNRLLELCILVNPDAVKEALKQRDYALAPSQIVKVYPLLDKFYIPKDQSHAEKHAIICYCPVERPGAEEEAAVLVSGLNHAGFRTHIHSWSQFSEMRDWMTDKLDEIKDTTSVLFVAIMAHGFSGNVQGDAGSYGGITDIIAITRQGFPTEIPIVSKSDLSLRLHARDFQPEFLL